jgi:hypothetical protein
MTVFGRRTDERAADQKAADEKLADETGAARHRVDTPTDEQTTADVERVRIPTGHAMATTTAPRTVPLGERTPVERGWGGRTSGLAVFGLVLGMTAVYAALSGRLAPVGVAAGVLGLLFSVAGMSATRRRGVTGRGVALFGLVASIVGVVFAILAMNGVASWLNGDADQVAQARDWLNRHLDWLRRW